MIQEGKTLSLIGFHPRWHIQRRELPSYASMDVLPPRHMSMRKKRANTSDGRIKRVNRGYTSQWSRNCETATTGWYLSKC